MQGVERVRRALSNAYKIMRIQRFVYVVLGISHPSVEREGRKGT
jgi:hypothetical protein